jgi:hypothetical protein
MKAFAGNTRSASSVRTSPAVALTHPSYRRPAIQAAAALHNLISQFRLKRKQDFKKTGHA